MSKAHRFAMSAVCAVVFVGAVFVMPGFLYCEPPQTIKLPAPQTSGGMPVMQAFKERRSQRVFSNKELPLTAISNLLWAACGINRPESGMRTNPTAMNFQEFDVYLVRKDGAYRYDPFKNELLLVAAGDVRGNTGSQEFVAHAPVNLVFVADLSRIRAASFQEQVGLAHIDAGFISENVYLYCASEGLATVVRGWFDEETVRNALKLKANQKPILCQSVGYPAG
jgi:SagB-type dehydrogenase family enzyme